MFAKLRGPTDHKDTMSALFAWNKCISQYLRLFAKLFAQIKQSANLDSLIGKELSTQIIKN